VAVPFTKSLEQVEFGARQWNLRSLGIAQLSQTAIEDPAVEYPARRVMAMRRSTSFRPAHGDAAGRHPVFAERSGGAVEMRDEP
jgi:hypothetical protein